MLDVIILADFLGPLDNTFNSRFLYLGDLLAGDDQVEIITSDFDHGRKNYFTREIERHDYPITMLHEGAYHKNISMKRFQGHYRWGNNVKAYLEKRKKPDVIYCAIPTLWASYQAARYCEREGVRFVIDLQDLWPEAFQMAFNVPVASDIVFTPFKLIADGIYKRADAVCGVSKTYVERALRVNKKGAKGHVVFLGTELNQFDRNAESYPIDKPEDELWIGYCGTLGASYDLSVAIDALAILKTRGIKAPKFIVLGDGERREEFEKRARDKGVECVFTGMLPYDQMCGWLKACDIAVNTITHKAAQSIINKHADYVAAGLPVLNTQESEEYCSLVDEYQMGFNCRNNDAVDFAEKLIILASDRELRQKMGTNARRCAEERFDRRTTYHELVRAITDDRG